MAKLKGMAEWVAPRLAKCEAAADKLARRIERLRAEWNVAGNKLADLNNEIADLKGLLAPDEGSDAEKPVIKVWEGLEPVEPEPDYTEDFTIKEEGE